MITQSGDVQVAEINSQHGGYDRTQEVGHGRSVGIREPQRTALDPMPEQAVRRQELAGEDHMTQSRHRRGRIPLHVDASPMGAQQQGIFCLQLNRQKNPLLKSDISEAWSP